MFLKLSSRENLLNPRVINFCLQNYALWKNNFIYLFLAVLSLRCCSGFSLVVEGAGYSLVAVCRLLIMVASVVVKHMDSRAWTLELWLPGSRAQAPWLCVGLVALWHVGSSWTRDWTRISCTGRWILYHWATREAPKLCAFMSLFGIHVFFSRWLKLEHNQRGSW